MDRLSPGRYVIEGDLRRAFRYCQSRNPSLDVATVGAQVSVSIIRHFLGDEWVEMYVTSSNAGFITRDHQIGTDGRTEISRVIYFAELLFNLQYKENFRELLNMFLSGDVESTYAVLEVGAILQQQGIDFRFHVAEGTKGGRNYDIEIIKNGSVKNCVEVKCKLEGSEASDSTVRNTLQEARRQLPPGRPGVVFFRIPYSWLGEIGENWVQHEFYETIKKYINTTSRISNVILMVDISPESEKETSMRMTFLIEFVNEKHYKGRRLLRSDDSYFKVAHPHSWTSLRTLFRIPPSLWHRV